MRLRDYALCTFRHHLRAHLAVALGVLAATAALTGALLIGDSLRASLRTAALEPLGHVDYAMQAPRFFRADLAADIAASENDAHAVAVIELRGAAAAPEAETAATNVRILGVDSAFWALAVGRAGHVAVPASFSGRAVLLNQPLADDLRVKVGDDVVLRLPRGGTVPVETLLGRPEDVGTATRLTVAGVLPAENGGDFALRPQAARPRNAFVPIDTLQRILDQGGRANALLFAASMDEGGDAGTARIATALRQSTALADLGLRVRGEPGLGYAAVESDAFLLPRAVEDVARAVAVERGSPAVGVLAYLANSIGSMAERGSARGVQPSLRDWGVGGGLGPAIAWRATFGRPYGTGAGEGGAARGVQPSLRDWEVGGGAGPAITWRATFGRPYGTAAGEGPYGTGAATRAIGAFWGRRASAAWQPRRATGAWQAVRASAAWQPGRASAAWQPRRATGAWQAVRASGQVRPSSGVPYSTVVALDAPAAVWARFELTDGQPAGPPGPGEILLNDWTASALGVAPGDEVTLTYYVTGPLGKLETRSATFRLAGVVRLAGGAADPGFTPEYPGLTDAATLADWKPPFPIDLARIGPADEDYWQRWRTAPKALLSWADGERLWAAAHERFGRVTSVRIYDAALAANPGALADALRARLEPTDFGLTIQPVRAQARAASRGTTDFAGLFIGFSMFLIVSGGLLTGLLFRLHVERRGREIGLLLALGFAPRRVLALLLAEGAAVAVLGGAGGLILARAYAGLMLTGLRTWWAGAVHVPLLRADASWDSNVIGFAGGVLVGLAAIALALRGLTRRPARGLLQGQTEFETPPARATPSAGAVLAPSCSLAPRSRIAEGAGDRAAGDSTASDNTAGDRAAADLRSGARSRVAAGARRYLRPAAVVAVLTAGILVLVSLRGSASTQAIAFFAAGTLLLIAGLLALAGWLHAKTGTQLVSRRFALLRLGVRNARRHPARSLTTAGLLASATFVITALQAMRVDAGRLSGDKQGGTGGFALLLETAVPLTQDLNTAAGRAALGLPADAEPVLAGVRFYACRLRPGDETSCLNLYVPTQPRLVGVPDAFVARGGFSFAATLAATADERANPWRLLQRPQVDDALPAIADEAAARWQMHLNLGDELTITDEAGRDVRLRLVALLRGSVLQGEVMLAERDLLRLFPSTTGYGLELVELPTSPATADAGVGRYGAPPASDSLVRDSNLAPAADGKPAASPFPNAEQVERVLEAGLAAYGAAATPTRARLAELLAVQNTYLGVFQVLGGLGLLLGTLGLTAVVLRQVWERRAELALLRTLGFSRRAIGVLILAENAALAAAGLAIGLVAAAVVAAPHVALRGAPVPWAGLLLMFGGILVAGLLAGAVALIPALRAPLLPALRAE